MYLKKMKTLSQWEELIKEAREKYGDVEAQVLLKTKTIKDGEEVEMIHFGANPSEIVLLEDSDKQYVNIKCEYL